ncbi:ATP-binding protein [Microvirga sp. ACRRW]|uniref:ATP-binding protein n=1 Tax=Microvirga sp. ACRRW TaxID=2918205 RepID=UPI001EF74435|nr:ATP-binding protein [Microvirga sp. ACRRW]MCG7391383.1 ATP-binding protein [Microvirga sp. ACRRW]
MHSTAPTPDGRPSEPGLTSKRSWRLSLRSHLALMCVGLALPILVFVGYLLWHFARAERAHLEGHALATAHAVAANIDRELSGLRSALGVLAHSPALQAGDLDGFYRQVTEANLLNGINVVLRTPDGQQLVNSRVPRGETLPRTVLPGDRAAVELKKPVVTDLFEGTVSEQPLFAIVSPVMRNNEVAYLLSISGAAERIQALTQQQGVPGTWTIAVIDRQGRILARNVRHQEFVGQFATHDMQENTAGPEGTWQGLAMDGQLVSGAYARSHLSDWRVTVGVHDAELTAPLTRSLWYLAWFGTGLAVLSVALAWLFGRHITAPMAMLATRAAALGRGEEISPLNTRLREMAHVGDALAAASADLQRREQERDKAEAAWRESEERFRASEQRLQAILDTVPVGIILAEAPSGRVIGGNAQVESIFGHPVLPSQNVEGYPDWIGFHPDGRQVEAMEYPMSRVLSGEEERSELELLYQRDDGRRAWLRLMAAPIRDEAGRIIAGVVACLDVDREKRAEEALRSLNVTLEQRIAEAIAERENAEAQLRQAQKMEAVGRLTGGVAHDFNNLLTVITGNLDMLRRKVENADDPRLVRNVDNAVEGARRAAQLTHRLLAFSRQSPLQPEVVDLNKIVSGMSELLRRTIGETIAIETVFAGGLWRTKIDQSQLESAILNLAVNARDAMPDGGKLTLETSNAFLDEAYSASTAGEVNAGQYVMVSISDTGSGMSADVKAKVFEPFFTTKPVGKGTGLGLAQVYGFARQSGGHAAIYSEPGQGTTVRLYFPRLQRAGDETPSPEDEPRTRQLVPAEGETILVVEDEKMVRDFSVSVLEEAGYRVLAAEDGVAALNLLEMHRQRIALLFTDVVLAVPLNGREVADEALKARPDLKVLFTTGYSRNAIMHHGRLDDGLHLITKPFTATGLLERVRRLLQEDDVK